MAYGLLMGCLRRWQCMDVLTYGRVLRIFIVDEWGPCQPSVPEHV